jgi:hypothetical protein
VKVKSTCCHEAPAAPKHVPTKPNEPQPAESQPPADPQSCACCAERLGAAQTETKPVVASAQPTGELIAVTALVAGSPEHLGLFRRAHPSERTGVDARSAALFDRHVMRC